MKWDVRNDAKNNSGKGTVNAPAHSEQLCFFKCHHVIYPNIEKDVNYMGDIFSFTVY